MQNPKVKKAPQVPDEAWRGILQDSLQVRGLSEVEKVAEEVRLEFNRVSI